MRSPRGLTEDEKAAWARLAGTVRPLNPPQPVPAKAGREGDHPKDGGGAQPENPQRPVNRTRPDLPLHHASRDPLPPMGEDRAGLDSSWERKLRGAKMEPDFTLDLHGLSLDAAHRRLDHGLTQAKAMGARLVLVVTGKPRPVDPADRGERRGAIRAKILDWLAAGPHGPDIAAVRNAHRRHGGEGALYLVLKRRH